MPSCSTPVSLRFCEPGTGSQQQQGRHEAGGAQGADAAARGQKQLALVILTAGGRANSAGELVVRLLWGWLVEQGVRSCGGKRPGFARAGGRASLPLRPLPAPRQFPPLTRARSTGGFGGQGRREHQGAFAAGGHLGGSARRAASTRWGPTCCSWRLVRFPGHQHAVRLPEADPSRSSSSSTNRCGRFERTSVRRSAASSCGARRRRRGPCG